jgi:Polyketide cyclase / dehydrase and lipid transport
MARWLAATAMALAVMASACHQKGYDWEQPENVMIKKEVKELPDGSVEMHFESLVNVPALDLFRAFSDVEHHAEFIEGVTETKLVSTDGKKKVVDITNQVLGRPNRARIEWTIDEPTMTMSFRTLEAEFTDNSAEYTVAASPDGKRARITTDYHLRDKGGHPFPLYSLKQGVIDGYVTAVHSLKRHALGKRAVVGS